MRESTTIQWLKDGKLQEAIIPRTLNTRETEKLQEYFQNTPNGPDIVLRSMNQNNPTPSTSPPLRTPDSANGSEIITQGPYTGFSYDEVAVMEEKGLLWQNYTEEEIEFLGSREAGEFMGFQQDAEEPEEDFESDDECVIKGGVKREVASVDEDEAAREVREQIERVYKRVYEKEVGGAVGGIIEGEDEGEVQEVLEEGAEGEVKRMAEMAETRDSQESLLMMQTIWKAGGGCAKVFHWSGAVAR
ncbi:hypothetical protein E8E13_006002 [Curvularia kusanoi]|uniref:Uncharacterized protein n=1 Tax=Curvularia kusanoi TaxID=90978 RepID=A0A9P4TF08_CURKU|nr:hypothetical protein E8E13_006002 [Curvularia kusanoi]